LADAVLSFLAFWLFWLRRPKLLMKNNGLFYAGVWIDYLGRRNQKSQKARKLSTISSEVVSCGP
jgi:uncharacterized membrane protein YobD (UPF0266 family)